MCEKLVGLGEVDLVGINDPGEGAPLGVVIGSRKARPVCVACGGPVWSKGHRTVVLVDLPAFGRPVRLRWRKRRWTCPNTDCEIRSFIEQDPTIGPQRALLTSRAARWVTIQVGGRGRSVDEVAAELGCDWHTVNNEVVRWGEALLGADTDRIGEVGAVGIDKKRCSGGKAGGAPRFGAPLSSTWEATSRFDIVGGRTAESAAAWFRSQPPEWLDGIRWAVLDMSGPYRKAYNRVLPNAVQVADPFHVIRLANQRLDEVRRRVQNETLGHRGRKDDPLYGYAASSPPRMRGSDRGQTRLRGLLDAGDPHRSPHSLARPVRGIYGIDTPVLALRYTLQLADDLQHESCPPEINKLGRTIARWTPPDHQLAHLEGNQQMPPKPSTTSSNGSNASRSGYPTSRTTESAPFSTPGNPTGTYSPPSLPTEIRRADIAGHLETPAWSTTGSDTSRQVTGSIFFSPVSLEDSAI